MVAANRRSGRFLPANIPRFRENKVLAAAPVHIRPKPETVLALPAAMLIAGGLHLILCAAIQSSHIPE